MSKFGKKGGEKAKKENISPNPSALHLDSVNEIFKYVTMETIQACFFFFVHVCVLIIPKGVFNWNQPQLFNCVLNWREIKTKTLPEEH